MNRMHALVLASVITAVSLVSAQENLLPGFVEGTDSSFTVSNSLYLNFTVKTGRLATVRLRSIPTIITLEFDQQASEQELRVSVLDLPSNTTFHVYFDDLSNHEVMKTDKQGRLGFSLPDLSTHRTIFIKPKPSTLFLREDGWYHGEMKIEGEDSVSWDAESRVARVHRNLHQTVQIEVDRAVVDGQGFQVFADMAIGIFIPRRRHLTVRKFNFRGCTYGIFTQGDSCLITENTFRENVFGMYSSAHSKGSTIERNEFHNNNLIAPNVGITVDIYSACTLRANTFSAQGNSGIFLHKAVADAKGIVVITDNVIQNNRRGITVSGHPQASVLAYISGNTIISNITGIEAIQAGDLRLESNIISNNDDGVVLRRCATGLVSQNEIIGNRGRAIRLVGSQSLPCSRNLIARNLLQGNIIGLVLDTNAVENTIYQNKFENLENISFSQAGVNRLDNGSTWGGNWWSDWQIQERREMNDGKCIDGYPFVQTWSGFDRFSADPNPPVTSLHLPAPDGANGWYQTNVPISFSATDDQSGIWKTSYRTIRVLSEITRAYSSPFTLDLDGRYTLQYGSTDMMGNHEEVSTVFVNIDKTIPGISTKVSGTPGIGGWIKSEATITASASDNMSGVESFDYSFDQVTWISCPAVLQISDQGAFPLYFRAFDQAGNVRNHSVNLKIDYTPPVPDVPELPRVVGFGRAEVPIPTATDAVAGKINGTTTSARVYTTVGEYTIEWTYNDGHGNSSKQTQTVVVLAPGTDIEPPIPDVPELAPITGQCQVHITQIPTATDKVSGQITGITNAPLTYTQQGEYEIIWTYTDLAGNSSSQIQRVIVRDDTPPEFGEVEREIVVFVQDKKGTAVAVPLPKAYDNCTAEPQVTSDAPALFPPGTTKVTFTATDEAGNSSTATTMVRAIYRFKGFLPPLREGGVYKRGQTIPVKFQLSKSSGSLISTATAHLTVSQPGKDVPFGSPGIISYDAKSRHYIFHLDTKRYGISESVWVISVVLDDGKKYSLPISVR